MYNDVAKINSQYGKFEVPILKKMLNSIIKKQSSLIDLRAPNEYKDGTIFGSINLPILNDSEREQVGKTYKNKGNKAAEELGYYLIDGKKKEKLVDLWKNFILLNEGTKIYCARGGKRSEIAQKWLMESGIKIDRIEGGFKALRNACIDILEKASLDKKDWLILAGKTGSAKTKLINFFNNSIDLEGLANHRGSAFGSHDTPQPTLINFENTLASSYLNISEKVIFFEDESRTIGRLVIPENFYKKMKRSNLVVIEESLEFRVKNIYEEYVLNNINDSDPNLLSVLLRENLAKISRRLGGVNYKKVDSLIERAFKDNDENTHHEWIAVLLSTYYDKMYEYQLDQKKEKCVYNGDWKEVQDYLSAYEKF